MNDLVTINTVKNNCKVASVDHAVSVIAEFSIKAA